MAQGVLDVSGWRGLLLCSLARFSSGLCTCYSHQHLDSTPESVFIHHDNPRRTLAVRLSVWQEAETCQGAAHRPR